MEYKSEIHEQMVKEYLERQPIVECLYADGNTCNPFCNRFYDCWVEPQEQKQGKLEISAHKA